MSKQILVNASHYETRVATLEDGEIRQLHIEREEDKNVVGNIYLGLVKRVLPGMQAAFLELGLERTAFLYVDDIIDNPFGPDVDLLDEDEDEGGDDGDDEEDGEEDEKEGKAERGKGPRARQQKGGKGRFRRRRMRGSANIQDLIKEGQEILVQVAKAPIGTKGARLTTHISLPGRNLVLMPTVKHLGISRRIEDDRERRRLRDMFTKRIRPRDVGFIIRTVAADKSFRDLKADADYLIKTWARIKRDSKRKRAPAMIHEDLSLSMRSVRDFFTDEVDSFVIDNEEDYENVQRFISQFIPRLKPRVKLFKGPTQLFEHYGIEAEISRALGKKVWLKSGGYLLIDQSEALTAVDVNTGRYVGSKSLEETIFKTNMEAVKEVAYQLRIRNVGGIIIIDLIDMESSENREKVYRELQEALSGDKSKTNILKISELGLVEMTRKRTHEDLVRYLTESCLYCEGRGYHKSRRTVCFEIFREIEKEAISNTKNIVVFASPEVVTRMTTEEKKHVELLAKRFEKNITVKPDPLFHVEQYEVFGKH
jgi:ribonuclease G